MSAAALSRTLTLPDAQGRVDGAVSRMRRGAGDPTHRRIAPGRWWRATRTPCGTALLGLVGEGSQVRARAYGDGAAWVLDQLPALLGAEDDASGFVPAHPVLRRVVRAQGIPVVGRTGLVLESLVPACIEQVVTGREAFAAFRMLVRRFGEPAPGPAGESSSTAHGLLVQPDAATWARVPSWQFLAAGVEGRRSRPLVLAATRAAALERTVTRAGTEADRALQSLPGIGAWTSAEVRQRAHGDADAWSIGDYHVGGAITWALTGQKLDDDACLEVLEPYVGHRYRVQLLVERAGLMPPRRGPRKELPSHLPGRAAARI